MKIIKRNGVEATFDISKIVNAINKANAEVSKRDKLTDKQITDIAEDIEKQCKKMKHAPNVEDIQDMVENHIMALQAYNLARKYITYRYEQSSERKLSDLDKKVLSLIECDNEEIKQENSNKNSTICSVQRDYMAGEISKELTKKVLLPKDIIEAHEQGIIHFHDADYFASHIHNCFHSKTRFITSDGIKSFADCHDGQIVEVMDKDGFFRTATVKKYGKQQMFKITFKTSQRTKEVICTRNHRWILKDGTVTTNINVGDVLYPLTQLKFDTNPQTYQSAKMFTIGFIIGDGCDHNNSNQHIVRLCGDKIKFAHIFIQAGYKIVNIKNSKDLLAYKRGYLKQDFLNDKKWKYLSIEDKKYLFYGLYSADGANNGNRICTSDDRVLELIQDISYCAGYHITSIQTVNRTTTYKENAKLHLIYLTTYQPDNLCWKAISITPYKIGICDAWCVEEPVTHSFILEGGMITGNCDLVNLEDMLQNGTVISGTKIEKPHSFSTACNIATQIIAQVASSQYGLK